MIGVLSGAAFLAALLYLGLFVTGTWILGGNHVAGESLKSIPQVGLDFGVILSGSLTAIWFLAYAVHGQLRLRTLLLPILACAAVFSIATLSPEPSVDGGIWALALAGMELLYGLAVGFVALVNFMRRRMEVTGELASLPRLAVSRLDLPSLISVVVLVGLSMAAWGVTSWTQDFNPNRGFDTPTRLLAGALSPLFVMLAALLVPILQPMQDTPRRALYWLNASAWTLSLVFVLALGLLAFADDSKPAALLVLSWAATFLWAGWTFVRLFQGLYPSISREMRPASKVETP